MASKKPCPGCGEVRTHRKSDDICYRCKELMLAGKAYEAMTWTFKIKPGCQARAGTYALAGWGRAIHRTRTKGQFA